MADPVSALDTGYLCFFRPDTAERFLDIPDSTAKCFTSLASTVLLPKIDSISELQGKERGCRMPYFRKSEIVYAGIYLRVSVEDEKRDESNSITNQRMLLEDYVQKNGMTIVDEYVDDGYSGTQFNRPGLKALMNDCRSGRINCVIVKDLSRLGRDMTQVGRYISETFPRLGVRFITLGEDYDSSREGYADFNLTIPFRNLFNEMYARDISRKVRATVDMAQQKGLFLGGVPPYGYMRDPEDRHHLVVDRTAAPVVSLIFELKISGMNSQAIVDYLNREGFETPMQRMRRLGLSRKSGEEAGETKWQMAAVTRILQNETYIGTVVSHKRSQPSYKIRTQKHNEREAWIRVPGRHEAIISREDFDCVQDLFSRIHLSTSEGTVRPLAGFMRCADCGMGMAYRGTTLDRFQYIYCSSYTHKEGCTSHHTPLHTVKEKVVKAIRETVEFLVAAYPVIEKDEAAAYRQATLDAIAERMREAQEEEKRYMALKARLAEDRAGGLIREDEFAEMDRYFSEMLEKAEGQICELMRERGEMPDGRKRLLKWITAAMEFRGIEKLSRKAVVTMIDYVYIGESRRVDIRFRHQDQIDDLRKTMKGKGAKYA